MATMMQEKHLDSEKGSTPSVELGETEAQALEAQGIHVPTSGFLAKVRGALRYPVCALG